MSDWQREEQELIRASLLGDIRDDIEFMGLRVIDFIWILGMTLAVGSLPFLFSLIFPFPIWAKFVWLFITFGLTAFGRYNKWPFKRRRWLRYLRQKEGDKSDIFEFLGVEEDGWLYRSDKTWHIPIRLHAPPWKIAVVQNKRQRLAGFEAFIRTCVIEGFEAEIHAEQVPDYRHDLWDAKMKRPVATEGIGKLKQLRQDRWRRQARSALPEESNTLQGMQALNSEYILHLSIPEFKLTIQERGGEDQGGSKEEIRRSRLLADLRERKDRVIGMLEESGHECTLITGYAVAELIGRWSDKVTWQRWKDANGTWESSEETEMETTVSLDKKGETAVSMVSLEKPDGWVKRSVQLLNRFFMSCRGLLGNLLTWLKQLRFRKRNLDPIEMPIPDPAVQFIQVDESLVEKEIADLQSESSFIPVPRPKHPIILTSPTSSGKTFLACNVAVACNSTELPVHLIDLTPDKGTLSVINPIMSSQNGGFQVWSSRTAPNLTLWTKADNYSGLPVEDVLKVIQDGLDKGCLVLIDMPWNYPDRTKLMASSYSIAVVDTDYHHWTQWELVKTEGIADVWLNMAEDSLDWSDSIHEKFGKGVSRRFAWYAIARKRLYQGRPLALEDDLRSVFQVFGKEGEAS